jgi:hypothetical protein
VPQTPKRCGRFRADLDVLLHSSRSFGDDPDKLGLISDGDPHGTQAVAFRRDTIPAGFTQRPGTKSRRIAPDPDQSNPRSRCSGTAEWRLSTARARHLGEGVHGGGDTAGEWRPVQRAKKEWIRMKFSDCWYS